MNWTTRRDFHAPVTGSVRRVFARGGFARALMSGLLLASGLAGSPALAQPAQPQSTAAQSAPPALTYRSAFERYKPAANQDSTGWREANDRVGRIGGWRVYAREAAQPESAEPARAAPPAGMTPAPADAQTRPVKP
jgi:hypothetical protein